MLSLRYFQEEKSIGTAGGLYQFRHEIFDDETYQAFILKLILLSSEVLVIHCDICSDLPLKEMYNYHKKHGQLSTIMSTRVNKKESLNYGCLIKDPDTNGS